MNPQFSPIKGILVYRLPADCKRDALDIFSGLSVRHHSQDNVLGLKIFFQHYDCARKTILWRKISVRGKSYDIYPLVTNLTIRDIRCYASESEILRLVAPYGAVFNHYSVNAVLKEEQTQDKVVTITDDYRVVLDVPEVLANYPLNPIVLPKAQREFPVLFFCRLCRQDGHKQYECPTTNNVNRDTSQLVPKKLCESFKGNQSTWQECEGSKEVSSLESGPPSKIHPKQRSPRMSSRRRSSCGTSRDPGNSTRERRSSEESLKLYKDNNFITSYSGTSPLNSPDKNAGWENLTVFSLRQTHLLKDRHLDSQNLRSAENVREIHSSTVRHPKDQRSSLEKSTDTKPSHESHSSPAHRHQYYQRKDHRLVHKNFRDTKVVRADNSFTRHSSQFYHTNDHPLNDKNSPNKIMDNQCRSSNNRRLDHENSTDTKTGHESHSSATDHHPFHHPKDTHVEYENFIDTKLDRESRASSIHRRQFYDANVHHLDYLNVQDTKMNNESHSYTTHSPLYRQPENSHLNNKDKLKDAKIDHKSYEVHGKQPQNFRPEVPIEHENFPISPSPSNEHSHKKHDLMPNDDRSPKKLQKSPKSTTLVIKCPSNNDEVDRKKRRPENVQNLSGGEQITMRCVPSDDREKMLHAKISADVGEACHSGSVDSLPRSSHDVFEQTRSDNSGSMKDLPAKDFETDVYASRTDDSSCGPSRKKKGREGIRLSLLTPPGSEPGRVLQLIRHTYDAQKMPPGIRKELEALLDWFKGPDSPELGEKEVAAVQQLSLYLKQVQSNPTKEEIQEPDDSPKIKTEEEDAAPSSSSQRKTRSRRYSISKGVLAVLNVVEGVLNPPLMENFLKQVRGRKRKKQMDIASHFSTNIPALIYQLKQIEKAYYTSGTRGKEEDIDVRCIKDLYQRLEQDH